MRSQAVSGLMLILLFFGMLPFVFEVQQVRASETIYIRADGSIDPPTANITTLDNVTYYLTDNNYDSIEVERGNIIVDGNGYTLQGLGSVYGDGFSWSGMNNVTIKNTTIKNFRYGIYLENSVNNTISGNNITDNDIGFNIDYSSGNTVSGNNITNSQLDGITLWRSSGNTISGNKITNNRFNHIYYSNSNIFSDNNITNDRIEGIEFQYCSNNIISGNTIANFAVGGSLILGSVSNHTIIGNTIIGVGMWILSSNDSTVIGNTIDDVWSNRSSDNRFYHNNLPDNSFLNIDDFPNVWDNGYPSGGNYWSNYGDGDLYSGIHQNETGSDGIGDTPVGINANNTDFYPLMSPYPSIHAISVEGLQLKTALAEGFSTELHFQVANAHFTETFNVTAYAKSTVFDTLTNVTVPSLNSTIILTWNATSLPKGNYNLSVHATPVPEELFTKDNTYTYWVLITIVGDVDSDRDVDVGDQRKVQLAMFSMLGSPSWDPNADIDCDLDVDVGDQRKQQLHMFESW